MRNGPVLCLLLCSLTTGIAAVDNVGSFDPVDGPFVAADNTAATTEAGEASHDPQDESGPYRSLWWYWDTDGASGVHRFTTAGSTFPAAIAIYQIKPGVEFVTRPADLVLLARSRDQLTFDVTDHSIIYIAVDGVADAQGTAQVRIFRDTTNDVAFAAWPGNGQGPCYRLFGSNVGAEVEPDEASHDPVSSGPHNSVWWWLRGSDSDPIAIAASRSDLATTVGIYTPEPGAEFPGASQMNLIDRGRDFAILDPQQSKSYYIAVDSTDGTEGDLLISVGPVRSVGFRITDLEDTVTLHRDAGRIIPIDSKDGASMQVPACEDNAFTFTSDPAASADG